MDIFKNVAEFAQRTVLSRENGSKRLVEQVGHLPETEAADVAILDDLPVGGAEAGNGLAQGSALLIALVFARNRVGFPWRRGASVKRCVKAGPRVPPPPAHFIAQAVDGDAEDPGFKLALLDIASISRQFRRQRTEDALGNFLGQITVAALRPEQREDARCEGINEAPPGFLVTARGRLERGVQCLIHAVTVRLTSDPPGYCSAPGVHPIIAGRITFAAALPVTDPPARPLLLLALLTLLTGTAMGGCASARPAPPAEWAGSSREHADPEAFDHSHAAVQVLICYGHTHGTHTGLRVLRPESDTIFWDPAGQYGRDRPDLQRSRDVFASGAPTIREYVEWRFNGANDAAVALFEWRVPAERAERFAAILRHEADGVDFETTTVGLFCCRAVCRFLERYAQDEMHIPQRWIRPEDLGAHLWSQHPSRVGLFFADGSAQVFDSGR